MLRIYSKGHAEDDLAISIYSLPPEIILDIIDIHCDFYRWPNWVDTGINIHIIRVPQALTRWRRTALYDTSLWIKPCVVFPLDCILQHYESSFEAITIEKFHQGHFASIESARRIVALSI